MSSGFTVPNSDINFPYSISVGDYQNTPTQAGTIFYNSTKDRFEGYVANTRAYNNSRFLPLSLDAATTSNLGGIKVGNNLSITSDGTLNAVAESSTQKFQKILSVSPYDNVADYTSINQCLTQFFGYNNTSDTFPDGELVGLDPSDYPTPSATTRYIIHLMPGTYTETSNTINLPPFVSLIGEDRDSVFINVDSTTQINCYSNRNGGQQIANLTINLNNTQTASTTAIQTANCSNILLSNINFTLTSPSGYDITAIAMSNGSNNTLAHIETDISSITASNNEVITLLTASASTSVKLKNCDLSLSSQLGIKRIINASSGSSITIQDTSMDITETNNTSSSHRNECILLADTDLNIKRSNLTTTGYDLLLNDDTHNNRAIVLNNTTAKATTTQTQITFTHYEDASQYDEILCPLSSLDFATLFTAGEQIALSGATASQNNQTFAITKIYTEDIAGTDYSIIQVSKQDQLVDETFNNPSGCTIKSLYTVNINNSQLTATNNTIKSLDSASHSFIRIANSDLSGDAVDVGNNKVVFNTRQVIRVGRQNADYASIYDAIQSINDNNAVQRYMIYLLPGEYYEQRQLVVPEYVSIIGENSRTTKLRFDTNSGSYPDNVAIKLASNTSLENISITQNSVIDSASELILVGSDNLDVVEASASDITNVEIYNCHIEMTSNPATSINLFKFMKTTATITKTQITATIAGSNTSSQDFRAFNTVLSDLKVYDLVCNIDGLLVESANTTVFNNDRTVMTCENPQVNLTTSGSSDVVNIIAKCEDTAETDITLTDISPYTNIIQGGMIRVYNGTTNYALYADYNATLFTRNLTYEGAKFLRNNEENDYPNSFLKTLASYRISADGSGNIYNISATDNYGSAVDETENVMEGEDVGTFIMSGTKNILFGIRLGGKLTTGGRNVMMGVDLGNHDYSISDNVLIGIDAGNVITDNKHVIIGSNTASQLQTGTRDVIIGYNSASSANNATDITVLGVNSGMQLTDASNLVVVGNDIAPVLGDGSRSVMIGTQVATSLTDGEKNIVIGSNTLTSMIDVDNTVVIGSAAAANTTSASSSVIVGANAAADITTMTNAVVIGTNAAKGQDSTASDAVVVIGHNAGSNIGSVTKSVIIGSNVGQQMSDDATMNMVIGGFGTANELTSGSNNIVAGSYSASALTTGNRNLIMGNHSGQALDTTDDTIILGHNSGSNISGGNDADDKSIIIGNSAGQYMQNGGVIFIGHEAGKKATGEDSIIIGNEAGRTISGARNTVIGNKAAGISNNPVVNPVEGHDNILMGNRAGYSLTTGNYNVVVGSGDASNGSAGNDLTSGDGNMLMGYRAGRNLVDGDYNFLFGREAGFNINDGSRNFIMGDQAAYRLNSGGDANDNMIIGNSAGYNLTEGEGILMIGKEAGYNATSGDDNLFIGKRAGYNAGSGSQSVYIGNEAGLNNTLSQNTIIGVNAGRNSTTAERNTFIGFAAGRGKGEAVSDNNTGDQNIAIGYEAGSNLVSGYQSLLIGNNAGRNNEAGAKNIMIGPNAGQNSTASKNIFIGSTDSNTGGVGIQTTGEYNIFMGVSTGENNTSGAENTVIGSHAGNKNTTGSNSIFIGNDAGKENTTGDGNIRIGKEAGRDDTTGSNNVVIGPEAGKNASSNSAVIIGSQAGMLNTADSQIFIGPEAGKNTSTGTGSVMIGSRAGLLNEEGNNCIFIGPNAGSSFRRTADALGENIYIGSNTGTNNTTGIRNIVIGTETFENSSNGSGVIAIGYRAGRNTGLTADQTDDFNNIMIGQNAVAEGDIGLNNTMIGSNVGRNVDNSSKFVGNAMIGADAGKNANLAINSVVLGNSGRVGTGGENNILAGFAAGDNLGNTNFIRIAISQDLERGQNYIRVNDTVITYGKMLEYFELGDNVLIIDSNDTKFESYITNIENVEDGGSYYTKVSMANIYDGETTINSGASLFTLANVDEDNIGFTDRSKASSNTLMGNNAATNLKKGSKNVVLGDKSMYNNQVGKYNNVLGTEAGYNLQTDNNTLFGTKTGYSLDSYIGNSNIVAEYRGFEISDNTITFGNGGISYSNISDVYSLNEIIEIENTSGNNDRYKIFNTTSNTITVEGLPKIDELGVSDTVDPNSLIINGSTYNFSNIYISGDGIEVVKTVNSASELSNTYSYTYLYKSGTNIGSLFDSTYIIEIEGSRYNDGLHYLYKDGSGNDDTIIRLFDNLYPELFDSNVVIKSKSITSSNLINSTDISFYNINKNSTFTSFLGKPKGVYSSSSSNNKFNKVPMINESILVNDILYVDTNYLNVIFANGYNEYINITNNNNYEFMKYYDFFINTNITVDAENLIITFDDSINLDTGDGEYYYVSGLSDNVILNIDSDLTIDNTSYKISVILGSLISETITSNIHNPVYFRKQQITGLSNDISSIFNNGSIINMNINHLLGLKTEYGSYIVEDTNSDNNSLLLNYNSTIPKLYNKLTASQYGYYNTNLLSKNIDLNINKDVYKVDSAYLADKDNHISGYDIFFQTGSLTNAGTITLHSSNNHITSAVKYGFKELLAPCMINLDDNYYLVNSNKYPFKKLEIDSNYSLIDGSTSNVITYHSVSVNQGTSNLALLQQGTTYKVFGNELNNNVEITPISNSTAISSSSVYLTSGSNIVNQDGNNKLLLLESINSEYLSDMGGDDSLLPTYTGFGRGYFKNIELNNANISIIYDNTNNIVASFYENIIEFDYSNIYQKKIIIIPNVDNNNKYNINLYNTIDDTFESVSSGIIDTFDGTNTLNSITTLTNGFTLYGKTFTDFKISTYGYLFFEDSDNNVYTINFLTTNTKRDYILASNINSNIKTKIISSSFSTNDILLISFSSDNDGYNGYNNVQVKLYLNNTNSNYIGLIEINYSNLNILYNEQYITNMKYIIGMENSFTRYKDRRVINITNGNVSTSPFDTFNSSKLNYFNNMTISYDLNKYYNGFTILSQKNINNDQFGYNIIVNNSGRIVIGSKYDSSNLFISNISVFNPDDIINTSNVLNVNISQSPTFDQAIVGSSMYLDGNTLILPIYDDGSPSKGCIHTYDLSYTDINDIVNSNIIYNEPDYDIDYGNSITVSGDILVVGEYISNKVFVYDKTTLSTAVAADFTIEPAGTDTYGYSLASNDYYLGVGDTGGLYTNGTVYIYDITTFDETAIKLSVNTISAYSSVYISGNKFGESLKITDSNICVVGSPSSIAYDNSTLTGAVYLYNLDSYTPYDTSNIEIKLVGYDLNYGDEFGKYLELHNNTLLVGCGNTSKGIYQYDISNFNKSEILASVTKIKPYDTSFNFGFGVSMALTDNNLIIGSPYYHIGTNSNIGKVYMYSTNNSSNIEIGNELLYLFDSTPITNSEYVIESGFTDDDYYFGKTMCINSNILVVGSSIVDNKLYLYDISSTDAETIDSSVVILSGNRYESKIDLNNNILAEGNKQYSSNKGSVFLKRYISSFDKTTIENSEITIYASDSVNFDNFGYDVKITNNNLLVASAPYDDNTPSNVISGAGAIYIYDLTSYNNTDIESSEIKIIPSDVVIDDNFGYVIARSNNSNIIACSSKTSGGSVYLYDLTDYDVNDLSSSLSNIVDTQIKLIPTDISSGNNFGYSLELYNNYLIVGSTGDNEYGAEGNSGTVYIYDISTYDEEYMQSNYVKFAPTLTANDNFGSSVSMYNNTLVVGCINGNGIESESGSIFLYDISVFNKEYIKNSEQLIFTSDGNTGDDYGTVVKTYNNMLFVGASNYGNDNNYGVVYMYNIYNTIQNNIYTTKYLSNKNYYSFNNDIINSNIQLSAYDGNANYNYGSYGCITNDKLAISSLSNTSVYLYDVSSYDATSINNSVIKIEKTIDSFGERFKINENILSIISDDSNLYLYDLTNFDSSNVINSEVIIDIGGSISGNRSKTIDSNNNIIAIGKPLSTVPDTVLTYSGTVQLFNNISSFDSQTIEDSEIEIYASDPNEFDNFGNSLKISNSNILIVGKEYEDNGIISATGSIYLYDISTFDRNTIINSEYKYTPNGLEANDRFGTSIAVNNSNIVAVGSRGSAIYLCNLDNYGSETFSSILLTQSTVLGSNFGSVIELYDNILVASVTDSNIGYIYLYDISSYNIDNIKETEFIFSGFDTVANDNFGNSLSIFDNKLMVCAKDDDNTYGTDAGSTYLYDLAAAYRQYRNDMSYSNTTSDIVNMTSVELGDEFNFVYNNFSNIDIKINGQIIFKDNIHQYYYNPLNINSIFDKIYYKVYNDYLHVIFEKDTTVVKNKLYLDNNFNTGKIITQYYNLQKNITNSNGIIGINSNYYNDYLLTTSSYDISVSDDTVNTNNYKVIINNVNNYENTFDLITSNDFISISTINNNNKFINYTGDNYIIINDTNPINIINNNISNLNVNEYVGYDLVNSKARYDFEKLRSMTDEHSNFLRFTKLRQDKLIELYSTNSLTHNNMNIIPLDYTEPLYNIDILDKSLNFTIDNTVFNSNNLFNDGITTKHIIPLKEKVPNEYNYSSMTNSNISLVSDYYSICLGEPVFDAGSNLTAQIENINISPKGFNDVFIINYDTNNFKDNLIFSSNTTLNVNNQNIIQKYSGNITINTSNIVLDINLNDDTIIIPTQKFGGIKKSNFIKPFTKLKPGNIISITTGDNFINTTYQDSNYLITNISDDGLTIDFDTNFNSTTLIKTQYDHTTNLNICIANYFNGLTSNSAINGQLINERINFANFNNIYRGDNDINYNNYKFSELYISTIEYPILSLKNIISNNNVYNPYHIIPNNSFNSINNTNLTVFTNNYNSTTPLNTLLFSYDTYDNENVDDNLNDITTLLDYGAHTLIIPTSNISYNINNTNLIFKNSDQTNQNITIDINSNVIQNDTGGTIDFTDFTNGQLIRVFNPSNSKSLIYKVHDTTTITSSSLPLDTTYDTMNYNTTYVSGIIGEGVSQYDIATANIYSSVILSSNTDETDLSIYKQGMGIIVSNTNNNNGRFNLTDGSISTAKCILLDETVSNETPDFCLVQKVVLAEEHGVIENVDVDINATANTVTINDSNSFNNFITGQSIYIENSSSNDGEYNISDTIYPTDTVIYLDGGLISDELSATVNIVKNITIKKIGIPIISTNNNQVSIFHYEDAQGNNMMLGSFTGQFCGSKNLAIHNTYIGNKVGQTNHGSGNLFFGSETGLATQATDAESFYDNKLAIYKNNFIGVPNKPLIGGDFGTGRVGINTIDPDTLASSGTLESTTRLVVNGAVRASAHSTFTGTHNITLGNNISDNTLIPGMCMVSSGSTQKLKTGILDTIVSCIPSDKENDKRVYGIYSHYETINGNKQYYVASVGEGMILVCNIAGEPENGDYVATSPVRGLAQLQSDDLLHNYTIAKITEDIDWSLDYNTVIYNGQKYKFKLVSCTYHCG
jgi:hypothetical protein